jgi:hypothetical protein
VGFARFSQDIPEDTADPNYVGVLSEMVDEVLNSDDLCCYLTASETGAAATQVVVVHSIRKYSAGFGALSPFQGTIMAFMGETIGDNLPVLIVQAPTDTVNHWILS